jgi:hypothetical protein
MKWIRGEVMHRYGDKRHRLKAWIEGDNKRLYIIHSVRRIERNGTIVSSKQYLIGHCTTGYKAWGKKDIPFAMIKMVAELMIAGVEQKGQADAAWSDNPDEAAKAIRPILDSVLELLSMR